jgi:hypothetical protein
MLARMFRPHPFVLSRMSAMRPAAVRPAVVRMVSTDLGAPLRSREEQEATTPRRGMATAVTTTSAQKDTALEVRTRRASPPNDTRSLPARGGRKTGLGPERMHFGWNCCRVLRSPSVLTPILPFCAVCRPPRARTQTGYQYLSLYRGPVGDKSQRTVHYAITGSTRFVYAAAVRVFILKVRAILLPANTWRRRIKRTRRA